MLISKVNFLERGMLGTNRGILGKIHLIFCKEKLVYYAVFYLVNADLFSYKFFSLMFLVLHQLQQGMLFIKLFTKLFLNFSFSGYHVKYHHGQDEV